jgi:UDPglucose--hexose-1-phosphate uridylyltransferase
MYKLSLEKPDGRKMHLYSEHPIPPGIRATAPKGDPVDARPHLRWHPLRKEWVIFANHRQNRTFLPPKDFSPLAVTKSSDFPTEMPEGDYEIAVFENLFPSMNLATKEAPALSTLTGPSRGICEVVVFTQDPETSLGELPLSRIELILRVLGERTKELGKNPEIQFVMPFENRGVEMGVTLHHPHGQIYAYSFIPPIQQQYLLSMEEEWQKSGQDLLGKIIQDEQREGARIIHQNEGALSFIPVFARYPYETWVTTKARHQYLHELSDSEIKDLADVLRDLLKRYDHLWNRPFPYLMTLFQAPVHGDHPYARLFFQFTPPYRTRDRLKFLAGTELGAGVFVNDALPEEKARELREVRYE